MTYAELHRAFKIELDKSEISSYPSFLPEEIDYWLNKAYLIIINQKFTGNNPSKVGFEQSQKRISDLKGLIENSGNQTLSCGSSPGEQTPLTDFLYYIDGSITYRSTLNSLETTSSNVILITHKEAEHFKNTRTNTPVILDPVMTLDSKGFKIYFDKFSVFPLNTSAPFNILFNYTYITYPSKIDITNPTGSPKIATHVHQEIATIAAFLAIENIESARVQTTGQLINIQE